MNLSYGLASGQATLSLKKALIFMCKYANQRHVFRYIRKHSYMTWDAFWAFQTIIPNQILWYMCIYILFCKIKSHPWPIHQSKSDIIAYLPTWKSDLVYECFLLKQEATCEAQVGFFLFETLVHTGNKRHFLLAQARFRVHIKDFSVI